MYILKPFLIVLKCCFTVSYLLWRSSRLFQHSHYCRLSKLCLCEWRSIRSSRLNHYNSWLILILFVLNFTSLPALLRDNMPIALSVPQSLPTIFLPIQVAHFHFVTLLATKRQHQTVTMTFLRFLQHDLNFPHILECYPNCNTLVLGEYTPM